MARSEYGMPMKERFRRTNLNDLNQQHSGVPATHHFKNVSLLKKLKQTSQRVSSLCATSALFAARRFSLTVPAINKAESEEPDLTGLLSIRNDERTPPSGRERRGYAENHRNTSHSRPTYAGTNSPSEMSGSDGPNRRDRTFICKEEGILSFDVC